MKNLAVLFILSVLLASCGSPNSVSRFYQDHKRLDGVHNATIPGWLVYIGSGFAYDIIGNEDMRMALRLARKVKRLQFMSSEDMAIAPDEVQAFVQTIRLDGFEDLLVVRDEESTVNIMVRERNEKLRHLIILVNDDSEFTFVNLRTNIRMEDLSKVIQYYINKEGWDKESKRPPVRKKKKKIDAAKEEIVAEQV